MCFTIMYIFTNQLSCDLHMYLSIYLQDFLSNHLSVQSQRYATRHWPYELQNQGYVKNNTIIYWFPSCLRGTENMTSKFGILYA